MILHKPELGTFKLFRGHMANANREARRNQTWSFPGDVPAIRGVAAELFNLNHNQEAYQSIAHINIDHSNVIIHEVLFLVINMMC